MRFQRATTDSGTSAPPTRVQFVAPGEHLMIGLFVESVAKFRLDFK